MVTFKKDTPIAKSKGVYYLRPDGCLKSDYPVSVLSAIGKIMKAKGIPDGVIKVSEVTRDDIVSATLSSIETIDTGIVAHEFGWMDMELYAKGVMADLIKHTNNRRTVLGFSINALFLLGYSTAEIHSVCRAGFKTIGDLIEDKFSEYGSRIVLMKGISSYRLMELCDNLSKCLTAEDIASFTNIVNKRDRLAPVISDRFKARGIIKHLNDGIYIDIADNSPNRYSSSVISAVSKIAERVGESCFRIDERISIGVLDSAWLTLIEATDLGMLFRDIIDLIRDYAFIRIHSEVNYFYSSDLMQLDISRLLLFGINCNYIRMLRRSRINKIADLFEFNENGLNQKLLRADYPSTEILMDIYNHLSGYCLSDYSRECYLKTVRYKFLRKFDKECITLREVAGE